MSFAPAASGEIFPRKIRRLDLAFIYGVIYSYYAFFLLPWVYPYAFLTVRHRGWLTR